MNALLQDIECFVTANTGEGATCSLHDVRLSFTNASRRSIGKTRIPYRSEPDFQVLIAGSLIVDEYTWPWVRKEILNNPNLVVAIKRPQETLPYVVNGRSASSSTESISAFDDEVIDLFPGEHLLSKLLLYWTAEEAKYDEIMKVAHHIYVSGRVGISSHDLGTNLNISIVSVISIISRGLEPFGLVSAYSLRGNKIWVHVRWIYPEGKMTIFVASPENWISPSASQPKKQKRVKMKSTTTDTSVLHQNTPNDLSTSMFIQIFRNAYVPIQYFSLTHCIKPAILQTLNIHMWNSELNVSETALRFRFLVEKHRLRRIKDVEDLFQSESTKFVYCKRPATGYKLVISTRSTTDRSAQIGGVMRNVWEVELYPLLVTLRLVGKVVESDESLQIMRGRTKSLVLEGVTSAEMHTSMDDSTSTRKLRRYFLLEILARAPHGALERYSLYQSVKKNCGNLDKKTYNRMLQTLLREKVLKSTTVTIRGGPMHLICYPDHDDNDIIDDRAAYNKILHLNLENTHKSLTVSFAGQPPMKEKGLQSWRPPDERQKHNEKLRKERQKIKLRKEAASLFLSSEKIAETYYVVNVNGFINSSYGRARVLHYFLVDLILRKMRLQSLEYNGLQNVPSIDTDNLLEFCGTFELYPSDIVKVMSMEIVCAIFRFPIDFSLFFPIEAETHSSCQRFLQRFILPKECRQISVGNLRRASGKREILQKEILRRLPTLFNRLQNLCLINIHSFRPQSGAFLGHNSSIGKIGVLFEGSLLGQFPFAIPLPFGPEGEIERSRRIEDALRDIWYKCCDHVVRNSPSIARRLLVDHTQFITSSEKQYLDELPLEPYYLPCFDNLSVLEDKFQAYRNSFTRYFLRRREEHTLRVCKEGKFTNSIALDEGFPLEKEVVLTPWDESINSNKLCFQAAQNGIIAWWRIRKMENIEGTQVTKSISVNNQNISQLERESDISERRGTEKDQYDPSYMPGHGEKCQTLRRQARIIEIASRHLSLGGHLYKKSLISALHEDHRIHLPKIASRQDIRYPISDKIDLRIEEILTFLLGIRRWMTCFMKTFCVTCSERIVSRLIDRVLRPVLSSRTTEIEHRCSAQILEGDYLCPGHHGCETTVKVLSLFMEGNDWLLDFYTEREKEYRLIHWCLKNRGLATPIRVCHMTRNAPYGGLVSCLPTAYDAQYDVTDQGARSNSLVTFPSGGEENRLGSMPQRWWQVTRNVTSTLFRIAIHTPESDRTKSVLNEALLTQSSEQLTRARDLIVQCSFGVAGHTVTQVEDLSCYEILSLTPENSKLFGPMALLHFKNGLRYGSAVVKSVSDQRSNPSHYDTRKIMTSNIESSNVENGRETSLVDECAVKHDLPCVTLLIGNASSVDVSLAVESEASCSTQTTDSNMDDTNCAMPLQGTIFIARDTILRKSTETEANVILPWEDAVLDELKSSSDKQSEDSLTILMDSRSNHWILHLAECTVGITWHEIVMRWNMENDITTLWDRIRNVNSTWYNSLSESKCVEHNRALRDFQTSVTGSAAVSQLLRDPRFRIDWPSNALVLAPENTTPMCSLPSNLSIFHSLKTGFPTNSVFQEKMRREIIDHLLFYPCAEEAEIWKATLLDKILTPSEFSFVLDTMVDEEIVIPQYARTRKAVYNQRFISNNDSTRHHDERTTWIRGFMIKTSMSQAPDLTY